jgi:hypothetical protein
MRFHFRYNKVCLQHKFFLTDDIYITDIKYSSAGYGTADQCTASIHPTLQSSNLAF